MFFFERRSNKGTKERAGEGKEKCAGIVSRTSFWGNGVGECCMFLKNKSGAATDNFN